MKNERPTVLQIICAGLCMLCSLTILTVVCSLAFFGSLMFWVGITAFDIPLLLIGPALCCLGFWLLDFV